MADDAAGNGVGEIELSDIVAAGFGHADVLSAEDLSEFDHLLETSDLNEEERQEFLQNIWNIIVGFIDLAWSDHPIQQAQKASGKPAKIDSESGIPCSSMVQSGHSNLTENYNKAAE